MSVRPDKDLIEEVATIMEIEPSFVEKDWFVTEIIALLSKVDYEGFVITFTGGTSLSKAYKVIKRFSEDIDYKVEAPKDLQSRAALSSFKKYIVKYLRDNCISIKDEDVTAQNSNKSFTIKIDYNTYFKRDKVLRPHIKVEMNIGALHLEKKERSVSSFISEISKAPSECASIKCSDLIEIAADKLSAITWRIPDRRRDQEEGDARSIVRHIHDLAILMDRINDYKVFSLIVVESLKNDGKRSKNNLNFSAKSTKDKFADMIGILERDKEYQKEYISFVKNMLYGGADIEYKVALEKIKSLINEIKKYIV